MNIGETSSELCTILEWDTRFWGFPIARLNASTLDDVVARDAASWCSRHGIRCLYFLAEGHCPQTLTLAHEHGFRFVDIRVELVMSLPRTMQDDIAGNGITVRPAAKGDLAMLRRLAAVSHYDARFFKDQRFDSGRAAELYAEWISRDLDLHTVFVCESPGAAESPDGYISCQHDDQLREGRIGLLAVEPQHQGKGLGAALIVASLRSCAAAQLSAVRVVTQGTNVSAMRLYERCGFRTSSVNVWFHKWF